MRFQHISETMHSKVYFFLFLHLNVTEPVVDTVSQLTVIIMAVVSQASIMS